ncbi:RodZ domain-containing protein [Roseospira navarrensis]|uniref:RodZ domain-containing protein n=1 Tax=Roseospira navarrensis TaxID=140058 RepID=UPI0014785F15|nr:RodZ domain-containing protein [Roseospira navarrensis]
MANSAERLPPNPEFIPTEHVGVLLQEARLRSGQDLRIVADELRIKYHHLLAIEAGHFEDLPGSTYVVGFIRAYAEYLGLDAEEIVRRHKEGPIQAAPSQHLEFPNPANDSGVSAGALLLVALILAGCAYGVWYWMSSSNVSMADLARDVTTRVSQLINVDPEGTDPDQPDPAGSEGPSVATAPPQAEREPEPAPAPEPAPGPAGETSETPAPSGLAALNPIETPDPAAGPPPQDAATPEETNTPESPTPATATDETAEPGTDPVAADAPATDGPAVPPPLPERLGGEPEDGATEVADTPEVAASADAADDPAPPGEPDGPAEATADTTAEAVSTPPPDDTAAADAPALPSAPEESLVAAGDSDTAGEPAATDPAEAADAPAEGPGADAVDAAEAPDQTAEAVEDTAEADAAEETDDTEETEQGEQAEDADEADQADEPPPAYVGRAAPADVSQSADGARIVLRANQDAWIQVRKDGELVVRRLLRRGDTYAVPTDGGYLLNTSNAGGLEVYVDGRRVRNLGPVGAPRNGVRLAPSALN